MLTFKFDITNMHYPLVSIIIPCYNQAPFLEKTLRSVSNQLYNNWECLIVNDGSTDDSARIAEKLCGTDLRFKLLSKKNGGLSSARNYGLKHAKGDFIQFLDGDDLLYEEKLSESLIDIGQHDIVITSFNHLKKNQIIAPFCRLDPAYFTYQNILLEWDSSFSIPIHCGLFKSSLLKDFRFNEDIQAGEDWLFWLSIYKRKVLTKYIDRELVCYRLHDRSMTQDAEYMAQNKQKVHLIIYNELNNEYKLSFFERFSLEALTRRQEVINSYIKREKRLKNRIKSYIKRLTDKPYISQ
ncbi:glycosyltransferase [Sphingobacterium sp. DN00404]|uniref:Glycosyltransferase n=1 Tax=Sphingobacterium micropteri TaxID=2763501 RepID=A0ABR7YRJ3_9SPHI|nr:glycosyltransferase [Sphingobacterium micropteri]MBD1433816.1 glycosyltransferase [Sphingobacterium micropteri]